MRHEPCSHKQRAADHFGVRYDDVTPAMRSFAKELNFGEMYGRTYTLSNEENTNA